MIKVELAKIYNIQHQYEMNLIFMFEYDLIIVNLDLKRTLGWA